MIACIGRALLVVALLLSQQAALAHELRDAVAVAQAQDGKSPSPKGDRLCQLHELLGTVLGVADSAPPVLAFLSLSQPGFAAPAALVHEASALNPRSRDPPLIS